MSYKSVRVEKGSGGWGGPLWITPIAGKYKIASVTGGGIHPVAQVIADLTGGEAVDGFKTSVPAEEMACVVIDCGGTARCGVYPKMGVLTVDVTPTFPAGPLMQYIKEDNFVSGVRPSDVYLSTEGKVVRVAPAGAPSGASAVAEAKAKVKAAQGTPRKASFIERIGRGMGGVVGIFYQAGRETIEQILKNILPFMAFVATIIGIILASGVGNAIANVVSPLAGTVPGLLVISLIAGLPFLSPLLGPGAVIAQVVGVLVGVEIGRGKRATPARPPGPLRHQPAGGLRLRACRSDPG